MTEIKLRSETGTILLKPTQYVSLPNELFGAIGDGMVARAHGNGMINAGIHNGDWLVFDAKLTLKDGDLALVSIDGQLMCRRVFCEGEKKRIRREDGVTPDIITSKCVVYAVMTGIIRDYHATNMAEVGGVRI